MPEPTTSTAAATLAATTATAAPVLAIAGISLGLRADVLIAGFAGAVAAIALLDSVPGAGDTLLHMLRTTLRRAFVALSSALVAGYSAAVAGAVLVGMLGVVVSAEKLATLAQPIDLLCALVIGGGAQRIFRAAIERFATKVQGA